MSCPFPPRGGYGGGRKHAGQAQKHDKVRRRCQKAVEKTQKNKHPSRRAHTHSPERRPTDCRSHRSRRKAQPWWQGQWSGCKARGRLKGSHSQAWRQKCCPSRARMPRAPGIGTKTDTSSNPAICTQFCDRGVPRLSGPQCPAAAAQPGRTFLLPHIVFRPLAAAARRLPLARQKKGSLVVVRGSVFFVLRFRI